MPGCEPHSNIAQTVDLLGRGAYTLSVGRGLSPACNPFCWVGGFATADPILGSDLHLPASVVRSQGTPHLAVGSSGSTVQGCEGV